MAARGQPRGPNWRRVRIAHFAGPTATIQKIPPLVTSNKARAQYDLPPRPSPDGSPARFDVLRPQRLAAPATVYIEQFSAHPLERDAAELYGPPDGYVDRAGVFHIERQSSNDVPVYAITIQPDDGLYPMPYMARQADGKPWDDEIAYPGAPAHLARQSFFPDGSRSFEEIDRLGIGRDGLGNLISDRADVDFYRMLPPSGYTRGLPAALRTDVGEGDIPRESRGQDFFPYWPMHLSASPPRPALAHLTNLVQRVIGSGQYDGAIWTEGSPTIEETAYWLNLLIDTTEPICGIAAQRPHSQIGNDGDRNIVDSIEYIASRCWADEAGRNQLGVVLVQEERIYGAREVQKTDARPGTYTATGGAGGVMGALRWLATPVVTFIPARRHTHRSEVNVRRLPEAVMSVRRRDGQIVQGRVLVKDAQGELLDTAIPKVVLLKEGSYFADDYSNDIEREVDILAWTDKFLRDGALAGFVVEGLAPFGTFQSTSRELALLRAVHSGIPVVATGRGNNDGFTPPREGFIGANNLTATKARLLLMAALLKLGSLPPAADPAHPSDAERARSDEKLREYQAIFETH